MIKIYKIFSKFVSKLAIRVLATNILYSKLVSISILETNLESKILIVKNLVTNG